MADLLDVLPERLTRNAARSAERKRSVMHRPRSEGPIPPQRGTKALGVGVADLSAKHQRKRLLVR